MTYIKKDDEHPSDPPLGTYSTISGTVLLIDPIFRQLCISDGNSSINVSFDDLSDVSGKEIVNIDEFLGIKENQ